MLVIIAGVFFQEAAGKKKKSFGEFGESVWKNELPSTAKGNFTC